MSKFANIGFTPSQTGASQSYPDKEEKPFERDQSDNKLFPDIQIKDAKEKGLITEETEGHWDYDTPIFRIAQQMETKYLHVKCKTDTSLEADLKNITEFKGITKKVSESSWLGLENVKRETEGLPPLTPEDFDIEEKQKLKYDEERAMEQAKILHFKKVKQIKQQFGLSKVVIQLGEGDNFRMKLPTCRLYKDGRSNFKRPLLLKKLRKWLVEDQKAIMAKPRKDGEMIECDDHIEIAKSEGYRHYRKYGWFNKIAISSDKDSMNSAGMVINPDLHSGENNPLKGKFKFPQMMLIEATDRCAGDVELVTSSGRPELKGYGFKFLLAQAALNNDMADNYDALGHLKDSGYNMNFGTQSAYKVLKPCKTVEESLQKTIDTFADLLPNGVEYKDHTGEEHDVDTITYMNTYFLVAYMSRSLDDQMDFFKLCKAFKVDTSKIEKNNLWTKPYSQFNIEESEELLGETLSLLSSLKDNELKSYKSLNKGGLIGRLDGCLEKVDSGIEDIKSRMFKTVQKNKETGEIREERYD